MRKIKYLFLLTLIGCLLFLSSCFKQNIKVQYFDESGETIKIQYVGFGDKINLITPLNKEGYIFLGWLNNKKLWNEEKDRVFTDIKLYPKFELAQYKIYFNSDGGSYVEPKTYYFNEQLSLPRITKNDYNFAWWASENAKIPYTIRMPSSDLYLTAVWFKDSPAWRIKADTFEKLNSKESIFVLPSFYAFDKELCFIKKIKTDAFNNCENLEQVIISDGIEEIGDFAFNNCENLSYVKLPSTLKSIGWYAFSNCMNIKYIVIPKSCENIKMYAFENTSKDLIIFCEHEEKPSNWLQDFNSGRKVYYMNEWEYDENQNPIIK